MKLPGYVVRVVVGATGWCWDRRSAGILGEGAAERRLRGEGLRLLARNWRSPADRRDEIDLILRDGDVLVFVEVRSRQADALVPGVFSLSKAKKAAIRRTVNAYLRAMRRPPLTWRVDVVEVELERGRVAGVRWYENMGTG